MKYIRTKDGRIEIVRFESYDQPIKAIINKDVALETEIVKEADSIKELLDDVVYYIPGEGHFFNLPMTFNPDTLIVYGAIWTDKGLIYVAKMKEETRKFTSSKLHLVGEWELL